MPPQVMDQVVAQRPVDHLTREPLVALARAAVGVQNVRLDVMGEVVGRVVFQSRIDHRLRALGVADFLVGERPDGLGAVIARQVGRPTRRDAVGLCQDRRRLAMAEPDRVGDAEREQIGGIGIENLTPDLERPLDGSLVPGGGGSEVHPLAGYEVRGTRLRARQCGIDLRAVRGVRRHQEQIGLEAVSHGEPGIGFERPVGQHHGVGMELQEMLDRTIERRHRRVAVGGQCQTAFVLFHCDAPILSLLPRSAPNASRRAVSSATIDGVARGGRLAARRSGVCRSQRTGRISGGAHCTT